MHSSSCDLDAPRLGGAEVLVALAALVTEGRTPNNTIASHTNSTKARGGFSEGPHCTASKASHGHLCNHENQLCMKYDRMRSYVISLWQKSLPLCIDVLLVPKCCCENDLICNPSTSLEPIGSAVLLEQWHITVLHRRTHDFPSNFNTNQLINAIRSQLYFSQISAWLAAPDDKIRATFAEQCVVVYCLTVPGESYGCTKFATCAQQHTFPPADIGNGITLKVSLANLPRSEEVPRLKCSKCDAPMAGCEPNIAVLDDRMQTSCTLKGKHRCEDYDELENCCSPRYKKRDAGGDASLASTSRNLFTNLSNQTPMQSKSKLQLTFPPDGKPEQQAKKKCELDLELNKKEFVFTNLSNQMPMQSKSKLQLNFPPDGKAEKKPELDLELSKKEFVEVLSVLRQSGPIKNTKKNDLSKGDILLGAILRSSAKDPESHQEMNGVNNENGVAQQETPKSMEFMHCDGVTNGLSATERPDKPTLQDNTTNTTGEENFYKNKQFLDRHTSGFDKMAAKLSEVNATNCTERNKRKCSNKSGVPTGAREKQLEMMRNCDKYMCDTRVQNDTLSIIQLLRTDCGGSKCSVNNSNSSSSSNSNSSGRFNLNDIYTEVHCDNLVKRKKTKVQRMCDISNVFSLEYLERRQKVKVKQRITFDNEEVQEAVGKKKITFDNEEAQEFGKKSKDEEIKAVGKKSKDEEIKEAAVRKSKDEEIKEFGKETEEEEIKEVGKKCEQLCNAGIPSALEQAKFRKSLDSAASMVFHSRTGLPLTSSPAPVRRGKSCFDFDSSINSVSAIRSALFSLASCSTDEDSESDCSIVSPCSPDAVNGLQQREIPPVKYRHRGQSSGLLGSFVESVLNGRLEPVSTVHGFSAELGASGSFCPRHVVLPVTVFFYTLGDNDKVSTPYLGHINLGKKGYNVPKSGTIQVTLFNPLGTVVKMFVIMYDLSDMPANSQTFIRQRTLFMPANCEGQNLEWSQKWLRYLIHLRFMSSKSGRIYLHSDIRMIICRKSDLDTATAHGIDMSYELRSFTHSPTNPKFSPRK